MKHHVLVSLVLLGHHSVLTVSVFCTFVAYVKYTPCRVRGVELAVFKIHLGVSMDPSRFCVTGTHIWAPLGGRALVFDVRWWNGKGKEDLD